MALARHLAALHALRGSTSPGSNARRAVLLAAIRASVPRRASLVEATHDELLFLVAFPPSRAIRQRARAFLNRFHSWAQRLGPRAIPTLADTGIAGTTTTAALPWSCARWLRRRSQQVAIIVADKSAADRLEPVARAAITAAEEDAFDSGAWNTGEYIRRRGGRNPFPWLVPLGAARNRALAHAFDAAGAPLVWSLGGSPWSASRNRVPVAAPVVRRAFRRVPDDPRGLVATPLRGIRRLRGAEATQWMDASMAALAARAREVTPTMDPNPDEIYLADLGEGAALCVLGAHPEVRCALEANYGYVMFSNGVPIGYGGVTPLADQANTGANLFPAFRGSEAAFLFAQSLRAFRTLFGVSRFIVNPYQFGADNDEALASGAFWFYDRLGFRSVRRSLRALADRERALSRRHHGRRSSRAVLRRLATADLVLDLGANTMPLFPEDHLVTLGQRVATHLAGLGDGALAPDAARPGWRMRRRASMREGHRLLGPLLMLIEREIRQWPLRDRAALAAVIGAKGARQERTYVQLSRHRPRLWRALDIAARARP
ncbi:MAG: hypothetical protein IPK85_10925 [Gemmatimonadetes bacterium]|nr:hypothetical protein [Gemmatimonadota bacterium]